MVFEQLENKRNWKTSVLTWSSTKHRTLPAGPGLSRRLGRRRRLQARRGLRAASFFKSVVSKLTDVSICVKVPFFRADPVGGGHSWMAEDRGGRKKELGRGSQLAIRPSVCCRRQPKNSRSFVYCRSDKKVNIFKHLPFFFHHTFSKEF